MTREPTLDEIRRVRHAISTQLGHDPRRIVSYYADLQRKHQERIVNRSGECALPTISPSGKNPTSASDAAN